MNNLFEQCGSISLSKKTRSENTLEDASRERQEGIPRSVVTGISLQGVSGARQRKCGCGMWPPKDAERPPCNEGRHLGRVQRKILGRKKSSEWTLERIREGYDKVAKMKLDAWVLSRQI